jgi:Galactose oxidase, central domain
MRFTWHQLDADGPGPRSRHCLWYDSDRRATILFGGLVWHSRGNSDFPSGTWELRDGRWRPIDFHTAPTPRHRGAAVFNSRMGCAVLFGGQARSNRMLGDTWLHKERFWQRRRFWRAPSSRCGHAMAYDEATEQVVLFGGINAFGGPLGDTWLFDGSWRRGPSFGPRPRRYSAFAYDPDLKGCVLHGGSKDDAGEIMYGDAWLFRAGAWERLPSSLSTSPHDDHALAYHCSAKRLVMIGGKMSGQNMLVFAKDGWESFSTSLPQHQCAPVTYDEQLGGLVHYGGETGHEGRQYDSTRLLRFTNDS